MKRASLAAAAAASTFLAAAGCASTGTASSPFSDAAPADDQIRIEVRNLNWNEARLYAVSTGRRIRLGTVGGNQDAVYTLDWDFSLPLALEIQLVAGASCTTRQMQVDPGDLLELQIQSDSATRDFCRAFG